MARIPVLERPPALKVLGIGFLVVLLFFVWLTWAFFNKTFVSTVDVTLETTRAGSQLPAAADVKLRGMIVGEVTDREVTDDGVVMTLGLKPEMIDAVPAGVTAQIVPKTLFGEKYVSLIPPENDTGRSLQGGDIITKTDVPIELEEVLNNLYSLLEAVQPAELSYTLTAVADALEGRGEQLGDTLVSVDDYLTEINPDVEQLVDDLIHLGEVSDVYAAALPDLARVLQNTVVTGNTVVEKQAQLQAFFVNTSMLADTLTGFVGTSGQDLITLNRDARRGLYQTARYSATFPCFLAALDTSVERLESIFRENAVHIDLEIINPLSTPDMPGGMPDPYTSDESAVSDYDEFNAPENAHLVEPTCLDLDALAAGEEIYSQAHPYPGPEFGADLYGLVGIKSPHGKFFNAEDLPDDGAERAAVASQQWNVLDRVIAASQGRSADQSSDLGALLLGPVLDGSGVTISEAR